MGYEKILTLHDAYCQYCCGTLDKKQLESIIFTFVQKNPHRFHLNLQDAEDCTDYLCWLYPRLGKAIDRYNDLGTSFDAYVASIIRWSLREYRFKAIDKDALEYSCWKANAEEELYVANEEEEYGRYGAVQPERLKINNPRQILFLLLKCYYFLSDDFISKAAILLNLEREYLISLIDLLHTKRLYQEEKIHQLKERVNSQYYRCVSYASRMEAAPAGSSHHERMKRCLENGRRRLISMRKRLANMRATASNKQIAEILGIPKGTVDSSIHALKEKAGLACGL